MREQRPLPGSDDVVAILEWSTRQYGVDGKDRNLVRVRPDGTVAWRAEMPELFHWDTPEDFYVELRGTDGAVCANTWSCYSVELDVSTGDVLSATFTK